MNHPEPDTSGRQRIIGLAALLLAVLIVLAIVLSSGDDTSGGTAAVDRSSSASEQSSDGRRQNELVSQPGAENGPGTTVGAGGTGRATRGAAPLNVSGGEQDDDRPKPYGIDAVTVDGPTPREQEQAAEAVAQLEAATNAIHACEAKWQKVWTRRGLPGKADPLQCVYASTAMEDEPGDVRFDISTPTGYSYVVQVGDLVYRYSEYDGRGCRSIDGLAGCGSW